MGESMISTLGPLWMIASFILAGWVGDINCLAVLEILRVAEVRKEDIDGREGICK